MLHLAILFLAFAGPVSAQAQGKKAPLLVLDPGGHTQEVRKVLFTPDSKRIISVAEDKSVRIWDVESGQLLRVLRLPHGPGRAGSPSTAALSADGKKLAVGTHVYLDSDQRQAPIYLIDLDKYAIQRVLRGHTDTVVSLSFAPDGGRLASGAGQYDPHPRVWNLDPDQSQLLLDWPHAYGKLVAFAPDGRTLAVVSSLGRGAIFDLSRGRVTASFTSQATVHALAWTPDGKALATAGGPVQLWGLDGTLRSARAFKDFEPFKSLKVSSLHSLAFHVDGGTLLLTHANGAGTGAMLYHLPSDKEAVRFKAGGFSSALSPEGEFAALAGNTLASLTRYVSLCRTDDGSIVHKLGVKPWYNGNFTIGWSPDGKSLAWPGGGSFHLGDLQFGPAVKLEDIRTHVHEHAGLSLKSQSAAVINVLKEGVPDAPLKLPTGRHVHAASAYTLFGKDRVLVGDSGGDLHLFHVGTGERLRRWAAHNGATGQLAPSPDGRYFLSFSTNTGDKLIHVWTPHQDRPLLSLFATGPALTSPAKAAGDWAAWTPEGYYAASPGGESLIRWHVDNGPNALATILPGDAYRKTLYRPDVIGKLLEHGSLEKALQAAGR